VIVLRSFFMNPQELIDSARMDGASVEDPHPDRPAAVEGVGRFIGLFYAVTY